MTEKQEILKRFISDERMSGVVYNAILEQFLESVPMSYGIEVIAATKIAADRLKEAWSAMARLKDVKTKGNDPVNNIGL